MKKVILLWVAVFFASLSAEAQYLRDHVSLNVGPSIIYADNGPSFRRLSYKVHPAVSLSYNYDLSGRIDLRTTVGTQFISNGDRFRESSAALWGAEDQAFGFNGQAYFLDLMPVYQFNPNRGKERHQYNFYVGLGIGAMQVKSRDRIMHGDEIQTRDRQQVIGYVPARLGINHNLTQRWALGLEGVLLTAFNSDVDGNNFGTKRVHPDILVQLQFSVRRYLFPYPL